MFYRCDDCVACLREVYCLPVKLMFHSNSMYGSIILMQMLSTVDGHAGILTSNM